jgi:integrase
LSERTISNKHERLRSFFRWLNIETPWMPDAPDYELSKPTVYTPAELTAIRKAVDGTLGIAIDMALMLGLREQELMYGEWQDVNFDHAEYHVRAKPAYKFMTKDREQRLLPIPTVLLKRLKDHRKSQPEDTRLILATKANTPNTHLLRSLKRAARSAGLGCGACEGCKREAGEAECSHWTLHKFRRSCLTLMLRNGIDARTVQGFAGHSSLETTLRYLSPANTAEMQSKVNAIWGDPMPVKPSRKTARRRAQSTVDASAPSKGHLEHH